MEYDREDIETRARRIAMSMQSMEFYSRALSERVIDYDDLYHMCLVNVAESYILLHKSKEGTLGEEGEKDPAIAKEARQIVAEILAISVNDVESKVLKMMRTTTEWHNKNPTHK